MIRLAEYDDLENISNLMLELFRTEMAGDYSAEGQASLEEQITTDALRQRLAKDSIFYIEDTAGVIEGVIELEKACHIAFLFSKIQKQGTARALCESAFKKCAADICTVGAFGNAIDFYTKLGFIKLSEEKVMQGIKFTLMGKTVKA